MLDMDALQRREQKARKLTAFASQVEMSEEPRPAALSRPPSLCFTMNPSVSVLTPGPTPPPNAGAEELRGINHSLRKALDEARQAYTVTKLALENEIAKRVDAEVEIKSFLKANSSLASTTQMLGAIVTHNTDPPAASNVISEVNSAEIYTTQSILYDVLEHQRAHYQQTGYPEGEEDVIDVTMASKPDVGKPHDVETAAIADNLIPKASQIPTRASDNRAGTTTRSPALELRETTNRTICMPYQCRPKWAISQNRPIFYSDQELARASRFSGGPQKHQSVFWQHPVRYLPASDEKNLCRTLIIDFLPLQTTMKDVLAIIRGGALESIQLFGPIGFVTDFKTARVVFHYELPADEMLLYWQKYGLTVRGQPIRVLQLGYTYPKNRQLDEDVFMRCYTRILLIDNINDRFIQRLPTYLDRQIKMGFVIEIGQADDGITMVEFTSVGEAAKAMRAMQTEEMFRDAIFDFEDDYCEAGSYAY